MRTLPGPFCRTALRSLLLALALPACALEETTYMSTARMEPLMGDTSSPRSADAWQARAEQLRSEWLDVLGPMPASVDLAPEKLSTERPDGHTRHLLRYRTEAGSSVEAFLLVPDPVPASAPAAVVFHSTSSNHIFQPVGLADAPTRHLALHFVRRGYVVLAPRCYIFGYGEDGLSTAPRGAAHFTTATERLLATNPGWTGMGKMLWDGMRAVDLLRSRPEVDPGRIVAVGHSLGAKEALYLAAFDPRIVAAVASEGGVGLPLSNWHAVWYLGPQVQGRFRRDHHDLLAMIAPRAIMIVGGGHSDGVQSRPWIEAARPVFELFGRGEALELLLHDAGHDFPDAIREQALDWLDTMVASPRQSP
jgi:dienelactone hydrolase